jgi:hypothetical protein
MDNIYDFNLNVKDNNNNNNNNNNDRLCGLVVRIPGITELYCASCEVRTEFIYVM